MSTPYDRILELLRKGPKKSSELSDALGRPAAALRYYLGKLREQGRVRLEGLTTAATWHLVDESVSEERAPTPAIKGLKPGDPVTIGPPPKLSEAAFGHHLVQSLMRERTELVMATATKVSKIDALLASYAEAP